MNALFLICLILCIAAGVAAVRADRMDRAEREWGDIREWHLLHGPDSGCVECEAK